MNRECRQFKQLVSNQNEKEPNRGATNTYLNSKRQEAKSQASCKQYCWAYATSMNKYQRLQVLELHKLQKLGPLGFCPIPYVGGSFPKFQGQIGFSRIPHDGGSFS
ncbi:hypothetical protein DPMN_123594 [Dreissena polymorpha]|uniref:Uncharacterized protein n=1 Tax=Dreissena polymorpha TaxID=45954 RepID=A0A9D4JRP0_DREPO|nr:hypothetical protein DPMN_123594 [Dreissena polymorpha]